MPLLVQEGSTQYLTGPSGLPIEQVDGSGNVRFYLQDQLGSTRGLIDTSGTVQDSYSYDAYGQRTTVTGSAADTPFGYAGQYTDAESGLQYLRARYYDPAMAQFLSRDPLAVLTGQPYAYAADDPLTASDPGGACPWCAAAGIGALFGGGAVLVQEVASGQPVDWRAVAGGAVAGAITFGSFGLAGGVVAAGGISVASVATAGGLGAAGSVAATTAGTVIATGQLPSGAQLLAAGASGAISGATFSMAGPLASSVADGMTARLITGSITATGGAASQYVANALDPCDSTGTGGVLGAAALSGAGGTGQLPRFGLDDPPLSAAGPEQVPARQAYWSLDRTVIFRGIRVYQRDDLIDPERVDQFGRTNLELMKQGRAPIGPDGEPIELHHMLQTQDSPIAEVTDTFHTTYTRIIHINPRTIPSGINRRRFDTWKGRYWEMRANSFISDEE